GQQRFDAGKSGGDTRRQSPGEPELHDGTRGQRVLLQARRAARRNFRLAIHGSGERLPMAAAGFETGRADAAAETADSSLVVDVDLVPDVRSPAPAGDSKERRSRRGGFAF